jgi:hypothetical protein
MAATLCTFCQRSFHQNGLGRHRRACALRFPLFVVERDGKYYQAYYAVGFLWEVDGRWVRDPKRASKYPKTLARQIGRERGGVAVGLDEALRRVQ